MGLTPLTDKAQHWVDQPSSALFPLNLLQRILLQLRYPLGTGLRSVYRRHWDAENARWIQEATHSLSLGKHLEIQTSSVFDPDVGCIYFGLSTSKYKIDAELATFGLIADEGIPGWTKAVVVPSQSRHNKID